MSGKLIPVPNVAWTSTEECLSTNLNTPERTIVSELRWQQTPEPVQRLWRRLEAESGLLELEAGFDLPSPRRGWGIDD